MNRSPIPLIARLRRRLAATVWLFALLVLAKSAVATACMTDDLAATEKISIAASDRAAETTPASPAVDDAAINEGCPDAAGGDCHCACAHAFAMSLAYSAWSIDATATPHDASRTRRHAAAPRSTTLRPPISC